MLEKLDLALNLWMWTEAKALDVPFDELPEEYRPKPGEQLMLHDSSSKNPVTGEHDLVTPVELGTRNKGTARKVYWPLY